MLFCPLLRWPKPLPRHRHMHSRDNENNVSSCSYIAFRIPPASARVRPRKKEIIIITIIIITAKLELKLKLMLKLELELGQAVLGGSVCCNGLVFNQAGMVNSSFTVMHWSNTCPVKRLHGLNPDAKDGRFQNEFSSISHLHEQYCRKFREGWRKMKISFENYPPFPNVTHCEISYYKYAKICVELI